MPSKRETILQALDARLRDALRPIGVDYERNRVIPTTIKGRGMAILRDGNPGEPDHTLSPLRYHWEHRAELEVYVQTGTGREAALDDILVVVGGILASDRTLGGFCDWAEPEAPEPSDIPVQAGLEFRAVTVGLWLHYDTTDPLQ